MKLSTGSSSPEVHVDGAAGLGSSPTAADGRPAGIPVSGLRTGAARIAEGVGTFVTRQPQWIIIGLLYLWVWYSPLPGYSGKGDGPLAWCWDLWSRIDLPLGFQLYVPAAVGVLIWSRRAQLTAQWRHLVSHYPEHHSRREGNLIPLMLGAFLLIFSHFVVVKGLGVAAAILIAIGVVYRLYGAIITRMLAMPFAVFLLMIPPPDTFVDNYFVGKTLSLEFKAASLLLNLIHIPTVFAGRVMLVNGIPLGEIAYVVSGFGVASAAALVALVFCLSRRAEAISCLWTVLLTFLAAFTVNIFRVIAIAVTFTPQPELSRLLMSTITSWGELAVILVVVSFAMRAQIKRINVKINTPLSVQHAVRMAGTGIETMALPLVGAAKIARFIGTGWTWSERRLEKLLKALTPKRKRRRRSGSGSGSNSNRRSK